MSAIEEPPHDRWPAQTYVTEYNELVIYDAIRRDWRAADSLLSAQAMSNPLNKLSCASRAFPDARRRMRTGKMHMRELSKVMNDMSDGVLDILRCTTIIETGIDIPNANTLIIENADCIGDLPNCIRFADVLAAPAAVHLPYLTFAPR